MFSKMLVPLDGSEVSEGILPWVTLVARSLDIPVMLLTITDVDAPSLMDHVGSPGVVRYEGRRPFLGLGAEERYYPAQPAEAARGRDFPTAPAQSQNTYNDDHPRSEDVEEMVEVEEWLQERASRLEHQGVKVPEEKVMRAQDKPSQAILECAEEHGCDLIVMARHERNFMEQVFKGSVTSEVIRSSRIPVMAITPEQKLKPAENLISLSGLSVLLDGSEFAESALPYVKDLASRLSLEILLIRWLTGNQLNFDLTGTANGPLNTDIVESEIGQEITEEAREASQYLQAITSKLAEEGIAARWEIPRMTAESAQDELMQGSNNHMIVLASHGRSGIFRWLEGSVAEALLKDIGGPLLVIPPAVAQHQEGEN